MPCSLARCVVFALPLAFAAAFLPGCKPPNQVAPPVVVQVPKNPPSRPGPTVVSMPQQPKQTQRKPQKLKQETVCFIRLGEFPPKTVKWLADYYHRKLHIPTKTLPAVPLTAMIYNRSRNQYAAENLIALMTSHYLDMKKDSNAILIGLVEEDIYTSSQPDWRYVFASRDSDGSAYSGSRNAVISIARMNPVAYGEPPNVDLLNTRLRKMTLKYVGLLYYHFLDNRDPEGVLSRSILSVNDLDALKEKL